MNRNAPWLRSAMGLATSLWLGSLVALALTAATVVGTVRELDPAIGLPPYNDPAFRTQQPGALAGLIVNAVVGRLIVLHWLCAVTLIVCLIVHRLTATVDRLRSRASRVREWLIGLCVVLLGVYSFSLAPRMNALHARMYDPQRAPELRAADRDAFMAPHEWSERLFGVQVLLLAGSVVASAFIAPRRRP